MKDEWIDINKVEIPVIKDTEQERIIIREYIPPVREELPYEEETALFNSQIDDEETVFLEQRKEIAYIKRLNTNEIVVLSKNEFLLGKGSQCDFVVCNNPTISRQHAKIIFKNGKYYLEDLNSLNHTKVNDNKIDQITELVNEDTFCLSNEEFQFLVSSEAV